MGANLFPGTAGRRTTLPARFSGGRGHKSKRQQSQKDGHSPRNLGAGPAPVKDLKGQGSKGSGFGRPPLHEGDGDEEHLHRAAVRSAERRHGKEGVSTGGSRGAPDHTKK